MMELAEALLRIPDQATRDVLIHDKLAAGDWTTDGRDMFVASARAGIDDGQLLAHIARGAGNAVIISKDIPQQITDVDAVMVASDGGVDGGVLRRLMASAATHVIPIITKNDGGGGWLIHEWHYCRDTTAFGGNVDLLTS